MKINNKDYKAVWMEKNIIKMIDQRLLPHSFKIIELNDFKEVADSIKKMKVRGAPAIGVTGAFGLAQAIINSKADNVESLKKEIKMVKEYLAATRPTAYDLFFGLNTVESSAIKSRSVQESKENALKTANSYSDWIISNCKKIGEFGNKLIQNNFGILTHCNAGALATVDYGTALAPIRAAFYNKKNIFVFVDETRPVCQGSRLTAWELSAEKIPHAIIADNAAGFYMRKKKINICFVGADRIAANGDFANKIGTYEKAVLAKENNIPFYVCAPSSTIDLKCKNGDEIPIEERDEDEVLYMFGINDKGEISRIRHAPKESRAKNPAFDVTPAKYVTGIITEKGIVKPDGIKGLFQKQ